MDFTGFSFNGTHSSSLGILRVSDGSRYQDNLTPAFSDSTQENPGGDVTFYYGTQFSQKEFNLECATASLTELQVRKIRNWLNPKTVGALIFDESPYKQYQVKISSIPTFSFVCFKENGERIYKGELSISFVAFSPFATDCGKSLSSYSDTSYPNKSAWSAASGMKISLTGYDTYNATTSNFKLFNPGDLPANWKLIFSKPVGALAQRTFTLGSKMFSVSISTTGEYSLERTIASLAGTIEIDTLENMVTFITSDGKRIPAFFLIKQGELFDIPASAADQTLSVAGGPLTSAQIEYNYLYF